MISRIAEEETITQSTPSSLHSCDKPELINERESDKKCSYLSDGGMLEVFPVVSEVETRIEESVDRLSELRQNEHEEGVQQDGEVPRPYLESVFVAPK